MSYSCQYRDRHPVAWSGVAFTGALEFGPSPSGVHVNQRHLSEPAWVYDTLKSEIMDAYMSNNHLDADFHVVVPMVQNTHAPLIAIVPYHIKRYDSGEYKAFYSDTWDRYHDHVLSYHGNDGVSRVFYSQPNGGPIAATFNAPAPPRRHVPNIPIASLVEAAGGSATAYAPTYTPPATPYNAYSYSSNDDPYTNGNETFVFAPMPSHHAAASPKRQIEFLQLPESAQPRINAWRGHFTAVGEPDLWSSARWGNQEVHFLRRIQLPDGRRYDSGHIHENIRSIEYNSPHWPPVYVRIP